MFKNLSIVLPTYNEKSNIVPILNELNLYKDKIKRIIFVDDNSVDGTAEHIKNQADNFDFDVICLQRIGRSGLSSAVIEGVMGCDTEYVAVMDSDGQHRPDDLMKLYSRISEIGGDLIIGSRFKDIEKQETHTGFRASLSSAGNRLANWVLGQSLTDPLTGFFVFKRKLFFKVAEVANNSGFKILIDFLYCHRQSNLVIEEMQISFRQRFHGESKLDSSVMLKFADQIVSRLSKGMIPDKFFTFSLVGGSGVLVHLVAAYIFLFLFNTGFVYAQTGATLTAMIFNYSLNNIITFNRFKMSGWRWFQGLALFILSCSLGALANVGLAGYLNSQHQTWFISSLAGVIVGTAFNFALSKHFVWNK